MAVIREYLARRGLGLHCDLRNEHAIVGNNVGLLLMVHYGSPEQKREWNLDTASGGLPVRLHQARHPQRRHRLMAAAGPTAWRG
jgi:alkylation response protein AidB-like acyl-CoA dehydrogenase